MIFKKRKICKIVKRLIGIYLLIILLLNFSTLFAFAHSGGTDANGGHYDHSTGEYHYHHGLSAHQHNADGTCPLDENYVPGVYYRSDEYDPPSEPKTKSEGKSKTNKKHVATKVTNDDSLFDEGTISALLGITFGLVIFGLEFFGDALFPVKQAANNEPAGSNSKTYYCPYCGAPMVLRDGKYGLFYGCSRYPNCYGTRDINGRARKKKKRKMY